MAQDGFNEFGTEHEIPNAQRESEERKEFGGKNLLELEKKKAAIRMREDWGRTHARITRFLEQWKVNQARSQGFTGVRLVKTQDEMRFFVPLGATPSVTSMNKAIRLKRRLRATLFADPPAPEVEPSTDEDSDREAAEFSRRALNVLSGPNETRYLMRTAEAWDLASDYGSGFIHFQIDEHGGGRTRETVHVRGAIPAVEGVSEEVPPPTTTAEGQMDPRIGLPWRGETVERMVGKDGVLVDDPSEANKKWLPGLSLELLTGKNVRFHPSTAKDIWDADGVSIGDLIPLTTLKRQYPDEMEALSEEEIRSLTKFRPTKWKELKRIGDKDTSSEDKPRDESLVFTIKRYQRQSGEYPEGFYGVMVGEDLMLKRDTWYDEFNDEPLVIPLTQIKQYWAEDNPYGAGNMEFMGPANEIRASVLGTFLEWLDKFRTRKTFVPITSTLQAKQLQSPTKTVIPIAPGQQPFFEDVPELPPIVKEMFEFTTADLDDESGLQQTGQALAPTSVTSGRQLEKILGQVRVGLSQLKLNAEEGILRGWKIMLQLARAFYDEPQKMKWVGEDGAYKEKMWNGSDLSNSTDVTMAQGSFTLLGPEVKMDLVSQLMANEIIDQQTAVRSIMGNVSPFVALGEDRHRQRVRRQIIAWQDGPPEGWDQVRAQILEEHQAQIQGQMQQAVAEVGEDALQDPEVMAQLQQIEQQPPPIDQVLGSMFVALPVDEEPQVAAVRAYELGLAIASASYSKFSAEWQNGLVSQYMAMRQAAGIQTIAEGQQAEQQAVEDQSSVAAQEQANELQMTQIRADAEIKKVEITQQGGLQKELTKAGAQPGSTFPETVAPPTLGGGGTQVQEVPGVTGERFLPGLPN